MNLKATGISISILAGLFTISTGIKDTFFGSDPIIVVLPEKEITQPKSEPVAPAKQTQDNVPIEIEPTGPTSETKITETELEPDSTSLNVSSKSLPEISTLVKVTPKSDNKARDSKFELNEGVGKNICDDKVLLQFSVAKSGSRADNAIYLQYPKLSGRIGTSEMLVLAEGCVLRLVKTGKKSHYFATFEYLEGK